jgi:hypothetical protein
MTSARQFEANRQNSQKSTGPRTENGKRHSRRNASRHGLCAETVIEILEDIEDYKAFEATITADYDARTAVERELVLRLASLLWRIRRATAIDTDLFRMQAESLRLRQTGNERSGHRDEHPNVIYGFVGAAIDDPEDTAPRHGFDIHGSPRSAVDQQEDESSGAALQSGCSRDLALAFLGLAKLDDDAFVRLGRYEARLWRQFMQTLFGLQSIRRRGSSKWGHRLASE